MSAMDFCIRSDLGATNRRHPVPGILRFCNYLQNVGATTCILGLQLSTFIFYNKHITLSRGNKIAQIIFEQLTGKPDVPYSIQMNVSYQNEVEYKGLGNYKQEYDKQTKRKLDETKEDIENISSKIYANVLTLMGVLVAVFSLISINYQAFTNAEITMPYILVMNLSMTLCVVIMLGLILIFINNAKNKKFIGIYVAALLVLVIAVIALCISIL